MNIHIRRFDVCRDVPIGNVFHRNNSLPNGISKTSVSEAEIPASEHEEFDQWLRDRWHEKDALMDRYLKTGSFVDQPESTLKVPMELRDLREVLSVFCFVIPAIAEWMFPKME